MGCLVVSEACCWLALTSVWNILGRRNCERDGHGGLQPFTSFLISWYFQQAVEIRRATKSTNFRISFFWFKLALFYLKIFWWKLDWSCLPCQLRSSLDSIWFFCSWQISTIWLVSNPSLSTLSNDNNWIAQIAQITQLQSSVKYHLLSNLSDWLHARGLLYVKQLVTKAVINFQILFYFQICALCRSG